MSRKPAVTLEGLSAVSGVSAQTIRDISRELFQMVLEAKQEARR